MAETGNTTRTQLINLEGLNTFLDESKKIFEPTLPAGTDGQVLKLSGGKPAWGTDNTPTKFTWTNGTIAGPTGSLTGNGMTAVSFGAIPNASSSASGVVTTGAQTFAGKKTFNSTIGGSVDGNATTATTADKTAHSLSIKDGASTPAAAINGWNGSADKTLTIKGESPVATAAEDGTIKITHGTSGVTAGTYKSLTVDAKGHVTAGTNPTTLGGYGITDAKIASGVITLGSNTITPLTSSSTLAAGKVSGILATSNIPNLDAGKITSGTIDVERLPSTALERCVVVANDAARFKLTTASVQVGDTVKVTATKKMYMVVDSDNLSTEAGYEEYFTSTDWSTITNKPSSYTPSSHTHTKSQITDFPTKMPASDVYDWAKAENKPSYAWSEITSKPSSFTPSSHTHGNITNSGAIGTATDKLVATTTNGVLTAATTLAATSLAAGSTPTVSLSSGTLTFGIPKGDKGATGSTGPQGVSISKVEQTTTSTADAGTNVVTVTLSNGNTSTFNVKNGSKGSTGATGTRGSLWYSGTGITGTSTTATIFSNSGVTSALVNDKYLNTNTGYVYNCTVAGAASAAKWVYVGSIKGTTGAAAGFGTPTASVDSNVGTPSVTVTASGSNTAKVFNFTFKNLKGDTGPAGTTSWNGITDKPTEFKPESHNHDNYYYRKEQVTEMIQDPTANTPGSCVGYGQDILGGY